MRDLIQKTIDILKMRVKSNLEVINQNQTAIKGLLQQPSTGERSEEFEKHYGVNKDLLAQNNDYINIQLTLINFLEKYKDTAVVEDSMPIVDIYSITDDQEIFDLTIKGVVPFNSKHPHFHNSDFIDKLISFHENKEEYEKCKELADMKSKLIS